MEGRIDTVHMYSVLSRFPMLFVVRFLDLKVRKLSGDHVQERVGLRLGTPASKLLPKFCLSIFSSATPISNPPPLPSEVVLNIWQDVQEVSNSPLRHVLAGPVSN